MPKTNDLVCYRGQDIVFPFAMTPAPSSIAGKLIRLGVKKLPTDAAFLFTPKVAGHLDEVVGTFQFGVDAADTLLIECGDYSYGVWFDDAGARTPISVGRFRIEWGTLY